MPFRLSGVSSATAILLGSAVLLAPAAQPASQLPQASRDARFQITHVEDNVFLVDGLRGQTWVFQRKDGKPGWLPVPRWDEKGDKIQPEPAPVTDKVERPAVNGVFSLRAILESQGYVRIKLQRSPAGYLMTKAKVGGKELTLMIDSGAPNTHLDRKRTEALGLTWRETGKDVGKPADGEQSRRYMVDSIEFETFRTPKLWLYEHDLGAVNQRLELYQDHAFDGILGVDVLGPGQAIINYQSYELFLFKGSNGEE